MHPEIMQRLGLIFFLISISASLANVHACTNGNCQLRGVCTTSADCSADLYCSTCAGDGDIVHRCHRFKATNVAEIRNGLPFNKYSWLTTHNSYAIVGEKSQTGSATITFENQEDSVTDQLNNGVRGLMLDMYDFLGDVWLCHSFGGVCYNFTAFEPAINTLKEIEAFLIANPTEIITIFIEDYVHAPKGLTKVFTAAGLMKYWFPVSMMPKNGQDWPTIASMIANNQRLLVFTSISSKESDEGIAYQWRYVNENQYGNGGMKSGQCPNRAESAALSTTSRSLILENFFPDDPDQLLACKYNSEMLQQMLSVCYKAAGNRWANFLAVDFYKRSSGGGAFQAVDTLNAELICGCSAVDTCKLNLPFGVCNSANTSLNGLQATPETVFSSQKASKSSNAVSLYASSKLTALLLFSFLLLLVDWNSSV